MRKQYLQKGQSLVEILFAIAIFTVGVATIGYLVIDSFSSFRTAKETLEARLFAREGIEAVRAIKNQDFMELTAGTHGLVLSGGHWVFSSTTDTQGKFRRTVTVRDIDTEIKEVTSTVRWDFSSGREKNISFTTYLSNWMQTGGEAEDLNVDINNVWLSASSTRLSGIAISNTGSEDMTITSIFISWGTPALLERISLQGTDIFDASSSSPVPSNTEVNTVDYLLEGSSGFHFFDAFVFDSSVAGSNFVITFVLEDGSKRHVVISP